MSTTQNMYLQGSLGGLFVRTAAPIVLIMTINGLYVLADAYFLGLYAGADALAAVTLIFPGMMMLYALQTLVSNGMASILARRLGAGQRQEAAAIFTGAHVLATLVVLVMMALYFTLGRPIIDSAANGAARVADNAWIFMSIIIGFSPVAFWLSLNIDALRCEGRLGFMTLVTISATLLNIFFNWLFMGVFHWGVAGSALGSVTAQALCLSATLIFRFFNAGALKLSMTARTEDWRQMLALGAPTSLGLIGISLSSAALIFNLRIWQTGNFAETIAAYGIITRILTFAYLPLMGVNVAFQTIVGNNFGAGLKQRSNDSLKIALGLAVTYCGLVEIGIFLSSGTLGAAFVDNPVIIEETRRILPWTIAAYVLFGVPMVLSGYFQAIGDAPRAGIFGLSRIYLFTIPLIFIMPFAFGEMGVWMATPAAELCMLLLSAVTLSALARSKGWRYGVLQPV